MDAVRREVQAIDPDQPVSRFRRSRSCWRRTAGGIARWGGMFGIFAVIALVLSSVGLYAVMAYAVTQRTQEIGVRMAVGAQRAAGLVADPERGLVQLAIGLAIGLAAALALGRVLRAG